MPGPSPGLLPPGSVPPGSEESAAQQPVPSTDSNSLYNQGDETAVVTDFQIRCHFERDYHRYMMPVASPTGFAGSACAVVQLAAPTLLWVADWTGARFNAKPMVPDPGAVGPNWVLMDVWLEPFQIVIADNGTTPLYRLTGTYFFACKNPGSSFFNNVTFPVAPWFNSQGLAAARGITTADLENLLVPTTSSVALGIGSAIANAIGGVF